MDNFWQNCRFSIFRQISHVRTCHIFQLLSFHIACSLCMKKDPKHGEDQINMMSVPLEVLWMISTRIVDFQFFVKFHNSGHATFFSFWTIPEHVLYSSKKLLIKEKTSSTWWVLLSKYYGWFLIELSIFDFLSSFTGPDLQKFSIFELPRCMLVMHQKSS